MKRRGAEVGEWIGNLTSMTLIAEWNGKDRRTSARSSSQCVLLFT